MRANASSRPFNILSVKVAYILLTSWGFLWWVHPDWRRCHFMCSFDPGKQIQRIISIDASAYSFPKWAIVFAPILLHRRRLWRQNAVIPWCHSHTWPHCFTSDEVYTFTYPHELCRKKNKRFEKFMTETCSFYTRTTRTSMKTQQKKRRSTSGWPLCAMSSVDAYFSVATRWTTQCGAAARSLGASVLNNKRYADDLSNFPRAHIIKCKTLCGMRALQIVNGDASDSRCSKVRVIKMNEKVSNTCDDIHEFGVDLWEPWTLVNIYSITSSLPFFVVFAFFFLFGCSLAWCCFTRTQRALTRFFLSVLI